MDASSHFTLSTPIFEDLWSREKMRRLFGDAQMLRYWTDVEVAIARVQAKLEIIPQDAADGIISTGARMNWDIAKLRDRVAATSHHVIPFIEQFREACPGESGQYLHFGATSQDIIDTGAILRAKDATSFILRELDFAIVALKNLAEAEISTVMAGRTHGKQALPITFGLKVASWLAEMKRHRDRIVSMSNRIFVASICGAVGTGAFIGPKALEFSRLAAEELKLGWDPVPWQASRDRITELLTTMIMVGSSIIRIGQELFALQKSEVEELQEPHGPEQIGSSTMPQKRNPSMAEGLITTGLMLRGQINLAVEIMLIEHERDDGRWQMEFRLIPEIFMLLDAQLGTLVTLLNGLKVNREKMRANIQDEFAGEPIVKRLSEYIGRQRAHEILHRCFMQSHDEKRPILETLLADNTVKKYLSEDDLQRLFQPEHYLGASEEIVRLALADAGFAS